jgi:UDP-N-acetylglucosamine--N-acetylmuramyl-(pentapeptide) pyrophosphoryl-undecaprenol N-acetylglucosamine transferase
VLSRSGASSIAEIAARCTPSLLVPYPFATANHQAVNARFLVDAGGARMLDDSKLDEPVFAQELFGLLDSPDRLKEMRSRLAGMDSAGAAARLADAVEEAAGSAGKVH